MCVAATISEHVTSCRQWASTRAACRILTTVVSAHRMWPCTAMAPADSACLRTPAGTPGSRWCVSQQARLRATPHLCSAPLLACWHTLLLQPAMWRRTEPFTMVHVLLYTLYMWYCLALTAGMMVQRHASRRPAPQPPVLPPDSCVSQQHSVMAHAGSSTAPAPPAIYSNGSAAGGSMTPRAGKHLAQPRLSGGKHVPSAGHQGRQEQAAVTPDIQMLPLWASRARPWLLLSMLLLRWGTALVSLLLLPRPDHMLLLSGPYHHSATGGPAALLAVPAAGAAGHGESACMHASNSAANSHGIGLLATASSAMFVE